MKKLARKKSSKRTINGVDYYYKKVTVGTDPLTQKLIRKDFYGLTLTELNEKIDKHLLLVSKNLSNGNNDTFGDAFEYWLKDVKFMQGISASTMERYWGIYRNYILYLFYHLYSSNIKKMLYINSFIYINLLK